MTSTIILFVSLAALIAINIPISIALGLSSALTLLTAGFPITSIPSILQSTVEKFTLLTIPLFVLAGTAMDEGGISKRLINVAKMFIGPVYGGLGYVMIVVALFFAAISGLRSLCLRSSRVWFSVSISPRGTGVCRFRQGGRLCRVFVFRFQHCTGLLL